MLTGFRGQFVDGLLLLLIAEIGGENIQNLLPVGAVVIAFDTALQTFPCLTFGTVGNLG